MGQVAGVRRGVWTRRKVWVGISFVDLPGGDFPPVNWEGEVPTAVQEEAEGWGQQGTTHKACLLDTFGHSLTQMIRQTCWTSPRRQTLAKLPLPLVMSHPVQLLVKAGPQHFPSGAPRVQVLGQRVQPRHTPRAGLHSAIAASPKHRPPLQSIPNPLLHLSHTLPAPLIQPLMGTTPLAIPPLLLQGHRDPQTAALHMDLARPWLVVKLVILATRQQSSEALVDILQLVIPPWCGGSRLDPHHQEEGTCPWPKAALSAPLPLQKVTNSIIPISGATGKSLVTACHHKEILTIQ